MDFRFKEQKCPLEKTILKSLSEIIRVKIKIRGFDQVFIHSLERFKLLTKFGNKGVINISKTIPLVGGIVGGIVGGTFDALSTNAIGNASKKVFSLEQ